MVQKQVDWHAVEKEAAELLSRYIQINTVNPPGNELEGALYLKNILDNENIPCVLYEPQPGRGNLLTHYCGAEAMPSLVLLNHIDVVPVEEDKWEKPPFSGEIVNGELWGRGALDCKSLGIMELMAFVLLKRQGFFPEKAAVFASTADEEAGGTWGVGWLMEHVPEKLKSRYILNEGGGLGFTTKGSNLHFCQVAEKGVCWIRIDFSGRPGHASLPHDENCVVEMAKAIEAISQFQSPVRITLPAERFLCGIAYDQDFMPPEVFLTILDPAQSKNIINKVPVRILQLILNATIRDTFTPTVTAAGGKTNVIPGQCCCEIDCRLLPGTTSEGTIGVLDEILKKKGCRNYTMHIKNESLPSESPMDTHLYKILENNFKKIDPGAKLVPYMSSGATDSRYFREKGVIAYGIQMESSLSSMERMHGHNERISMANLTKGIKLMYEIVREFCR